ncbi:meiosis 1 arrest protein isoform X2 [Strongylocentrotus purpuratus]|uniref:Meiosis 1 arrest protein n=1 Tax=Strongylocentrotus purpuratus TaxID=7668 RepID=A0A7M7P2S3_STRPU|nr:meiosis 1 arrest protein isoform X2 [Strongylocentrotus purpuratus]
MLHCFIRKLAQLSSASTVLMMEKQSQMSRVAFSRQPARILLVDFSLPFSAEMCYDLHQALEHTLAVACNMTGPARIPFFGLFALGVHSENLFPLQHVRGNFSRLQNALHELKTFAISQHTNLPQALQDAVLQFKRQSQTLRQTTSFSCQLEVIIITCKQGGMVSRQLDQMLSQMDLESIRKILVVSLASVCDSPVSSNTSSSENLTGILDVTTIEPGELSFQSFFTGWFHDCGTDREQLHLLFPNGVMSSDKLVLKCDLQERFIDPSLLPFNTQFMTCGIPNKPASSNQSAVSQQQATPVIKLRVMQMVKLQGICDSLMFGQPMVVRPTACWKLDWEELDSNQQNFHALCHHLHHREMCLVTRLEPSESTVYPSTSAVPKPRGHFIILPSPSMSLLIKPIAVNELMLPGDYQIPAEKPISDSLQLVAQYLDQVSIVNELMLPGDYQIPAEKPISDSLQLFAQYLDQLEVLDAYNPLINHCNLTSSLVGLMNKTSTRQPRKTKQQATVPVQPAFGGRGRGRRRGSTRPHQFQPASQLLNQPLQKKFCGLPMETDNCDFDL